MEIADMPACSDKNIPRRVKRERGNVFWKLEYRAKGPKCSSFPVAKKEPTADTPAMVVIVGLVIEAVCSHKPTAIPTGDMVGAGYSRKPTVPIRIGIEKVAANRDGHCRVARFHEGEVPIPVLDETGFFIAVRSLLEFLILRPGQGMAAIDELVAKRYQVGLTGVENGLLDF